MLVDTLTPCLEPDTRHRQEAETFYRYIKQCCSSQIIVLERPAYNGKMGDKSSWKHAEPHCSTKLCNQQAKLSSALRNSAINKPDQALHYETLHSTSQTKLCTTELCNQQARPSTALWNSAFNKPY
ncbi:hypothetical protein RRG08_020382 [Elysia crispata]|uniref:Uncharacterized protein n=1 Tax=Elysia crispata TaxID=231223 RepID=A0AAE0Z7G7_9GAST|nr:hypothetical protein RRG08_020382 [Elysia crispata]